MARGLLRKGRANNGPELRRPGRRHALRLRALWQAREPAIVATATKAANVFLILGPFVIAGRTAPPTATPDNLQWLLPGRPIGLGQSDRMLLGLFGSTKSCLKMKSPLGETNVGRIFRTSLIGVSFVSAVCAKAIVGHAKVKTTSLLYSLFPSSYKSRCAIGQRYAFLLG